MADAAEGLMLIEAIRREPENVPLRLIYADWLEDAGRAAAAAFLRKHAGQDPSAWGTLPSGAEEDWHSVTPPLPCQLQRSSLRWDPLPSPDAFRVRIERGLAAAVYCRQLGWVRHGALWAAAAPVARVRFCDKAARHSFDQPGDIECWSWWRDGRPESPPTDHAWADFFDRLEGHGVFADVPGSLCRHYATRDAAHGALSDAAAAWAQAQARQALGLGPDAL
jgi:uncharacterized protein (TIGR02996 family)